MGKILGNGFKNVCADLHVPTHDGLYFAAHALGICVVMVQSKKCFLLGNAVPIDPAELREFVKIPPPEVCRAIARQVDQALSERADAKNGVGDPVGDGASQGPYVRPGDAAAPGEPRDHAV